MTTILIALAAFMAGGFLGVLAMCIFTVAGRADDATTETEHTR